MFAHYTWNPIQIYIWRTKSHWCTLDSWEEQCTICKYIVRICIDLAKNSSFKAIHIQAYNINLMAEDYIEMQFNFLVEDAINMDGNYNEVWMQFQIWKH